MHYPIFNSIVNTIELQLVKRGIQSSIFKTWKDNKIRAIGLELGIELSDIANFISSLAINFDWDSFRETSIAQRMDGMKKHPLLKVKELSKIEVLPIIDIELMWVFDIYTCQPQQFDKEGNYRINQASRWMELISKKINETLRNENIITRWHLEIEGDDQGKYLSAINLISYFQYELGTAKNLNELKIYVSRQLNDLLLKSNRVIAMSESILSKTVGASVK